MEFKEIQAISFSTWNAGYRMPLELNQNEYGDTSNWLLRDQPDRHVHSSVSEGNNHHADLNSCKRKIANIPYRCYWCSVDGHIREWGIREGLGSNPIHNSQDRCGHPTNQLKCRKLEKRTEIEHRMASSSDYQLVIEWALDGRGRLCTTGQQEMRGVSPEGQEAN